MRNLQINLSPLAWDLSEWQTLGNKSWKSGARYISSFFLFLFSFSHIHSRWYCLRLLLFPSIMLTSIERNWLCMKDPLLRRCFFCFHEICQCVWLLKMRFDSQLLCFQEVFRHKRISNWIHLHRNFPWEDEPHQMACNRS